MPMLVLRCTQKVIKAAGLTTSDIAPPQTLGYLGAWYCNIVSIRGSYCLFFTHETTLYSHALLKIKKQTVRDITSAFRESLKHNLLFEGFNSVTLTNYLQHNEKCVFTKTCSRRVLGSMNDLVHMLAGYLEEQPLIGEQTLLRIIQQVNTTPMSMLDMNSGIHAMRRLLMKVAV